MFTRFFEGAAFRRGDGFIGDVGGRFSDVQADWCRWNEWLRQQARQARVSCICAPSQPLLLDSVAWRDELRQLGWWEDGGLWFCSTWCARAFFVHCERGKPLRWRACWSLWKVNVWWRVGRHLTADNLPSPFGLA